MREGMKEEYESFLILKVMLNDLYKKDKT